MPKPPEDPPTSRSRAAVVAVALLAILLIGGAFRLYNVNWDKDTYHIHPDERYTTMVITAIEWPTSLREYFDTGNSPLNPRNAGMVFFYGTFPLFLTKFVATGLAEIGQGNVTPLGLIFFCLLFGVAGAGIGLVLRSLGLLPGRAGWAICLGLPPVAALIGGLVLLPLLEQTPALQTLTGYDQIHLVGRVLSAVFDLGSVLLLFFFGRRLFDERVGLVASFLLALTVLNIQGSHYFAVDTFLTFFVLLTMWFAVSVAQGKGWQAFVGLGVAMGFTLACKVSVFLLAGVVALAVVIRVRRAWALPVAGVGRPKGRVLAALGGLALAALLALGIFRVAQPYAWAGPNYAGWDDLPEPYNVKLRVLERVPEPLRAVLMPNPRWIIDILEAGAQQTGEADMPWGRQWTERAPWLWPLENMVLWGMGVPLGVASWAGVTLAVIQVIRSWRKRRDMSGDRIPEPIDAAKPQEAMPHDSSGVPVGEGLLHRGAGTRNGVGWDLVLLPLTWVLLTLFWQGMQFVKSVRYFLPIFPFLALFAAYLVVAVWRWARGRRLPARIAAGALGAFVLAGTLAWALAFIQIFREPVTRVQATRWIYDNIEPGAAIAHEHFDDPLPFNMFGKLAYKPGGVYQGVELTLYDEDTPEKLDKLLSDLNQADYVIMSSGRLSTSITRLPMRYPVTTRYYRLLLGEQLGFAKAAEFHSYPRLLGIEFNDDGAEEQFTVYDHPKVLIYRKTAAYDEGRVRAQLSEGIDWGAIPHWLNPRDVPEWKREQRRALRDGGQKDDVAQDRNGLMLTGAEREIQEQGGTWAAIFDWNSLPNRLPTPAWLVLIGLLGLAALPLTVGVFGHLPDRGYILARPVGVLLLAWLSWMLTNLTPLHYSRGTIGLAFALIAVASLGSLALPGQRRRLLDLWRNQKRSILVAEALFLAFFALCWLVRWGNPDLWHAWRGGEKPMDFAYLNAVIKSTEFPPYDPWFAGGYLNYYYFGQVMVGTLIKLIGIVPAVAYNLVIPTWFAMTAMGAFSVTYNLATATRKPEQPSRRPIVFGIVGALFVVLIGNLAEIHLILLKLGEGVLDTFQSTIPGLANLVRVIVGSFEVMFGGKALPIGLQEWYWNATRAIPPGEAYGITEFPYFTFLLADLHAHLIAMPLTFLSLSAALGVILRRRTDAIEGLWRRCRAGLGAVGLLLLWALTIGAMRTTNAWDVPPHLLLALGALGIGEAARRKKGTLRGIASVAWQFGLIFVLGWAVLFQPFWAHYGSFYNSVILWTGPRTPLWAYLVVHGLFLFCTVSYLALRTLGRAGGQRSDPFLRKVAVTFRNRHRLQRLRRSAGLLGIKGLPVTQWIWVGFALLGILELFFLVPGLIPFTQAKAGTIYGAGSAYRGLAVLGLGLPIAILCLSLLFRARLEPGERLWAYVVLLALSMTMGVEVIVIQGDVERMNTVFKFYVQVWLFWALAAAVALAWIGPYLRRWGRGRTVWLGLLSLLLGCSALYPPLATAAKVRDRFDPSLGPGLNGWAYMTTATYSDPKGPEYELRWDYDAIKWLLDNVVGSPVILEAQVEEYRWGARYSINTGLPTVLGWNWHERQQRAAAGDQQVWARAEDVSTLYNTPTLSVAQELLARYRVRYVIVGPLEQANYEPVGLAKFERMVGKGLLNVVFRNEGVTIYEVGR